MDEPVLDIIWYFNDVHSFNNDIILDDCRKLLATLCMVLCQQVHFSTMGLFPNIPWDFQENWDFQEICFTKNKCKLHHDMNTYSINKLIVSLKYFGKATVCLTIICKDQCSII